MLKNMNCIYPCNVKNVLIIKTKNKMEEIKRKVDVLREQLIFTQNLANELTKQGVSVNFEFASDKKTVNITAEKSFTFSVKASINQDL